METNNYILINDSECDECSGDDTIDKIINMSGLLIGILVGYFGMSSDSLGPGDFTKSKYFETYIIMISIIIIIIVSIYYY